MWCCFLNLPDPPLLTASSASPCVKCGPTWGRHCTYDDEKDGEEDNHPRTGTAARRAFQLSLLITLSTLGSFFVTSQRTLALLLGYWAARNNEYWFYTSMSEKDLPTGPGSRDHTIVLGENRERGYHMTKAKSNGDCHLCFLVTYQEGHLMWKFNQGKLYFPKLPLLFFLVSKTEAKLS